MRRNSLPLWAVACVATLVSAAGSLMFDRVFADTSTPIVLNMSGATVFQNFDSLVSSGNASPAATPAGWGFVESGTGANGAYTVGTGSSNAGDTYSFGGIVNSGNSSAPSPDRAFGGLQSGSVVPTIGASFVNQTGLPITELQISYRGEQWRLGALGRADRLDFQVGTTATSLTSAGYVDVDALDFVAPTTGPATGALNGDLPANQVALNASVSNLNIPNGAVFFVRWVDFNASGADDGLAIDDFALTAIAADTAPAVAATVPAPGAVNVDVNTAVTITFSEPVAVSASAFAWSCNSTPQPFSANTSPATVFALSPSASLPFNANCTVTVTAAEVSDADSFDPPDQMAASHSFSFTTAGPTDAGPSITTTSPADHAANVGITSNISINFSESVTASPAAFTLSCGGPVTFGLAGAGTSTLTLDPDGDLPYAAACTVSVDGAMVFDVDTNDPPDTLASNTAFDFTTEDAPPPVATNVIINEVDSDQVGTDTGEFIELYDGGVGNTSLTGLTVVFFNGSNSLSYAAFDLDGFSTDASGYFTLGNTLVPGRDLVFANNLLQNGADAVALYAANASSFPNGTPVTVANLQDAVVYDSDDADEPGLLALLNAGQPQINENGGGSITGHSIGRCDNGTGGARNTASYLAATPSPDGSNNCPPPPPPPSDSTIVISQVYGGGGNAGAVYQNDYVELFNRGTETVETLGWTLQYASATGSGWDFNKTPLGGPIAPGEYYLVKLASNGAAGLEVPDANVSGPINLSGTNGKIALVSSFEPLVGNCPTANPSLKDLVGYGTADCFEGAGAAPAPSVSTALLRNNGGSTDTDTNSADLAAGNATPRRTAPIVELPPMVLSTDPSTNDTNVPRDPTFVISFTEPVDVTGSWIDITCAVSGQHNDYTVADNDRTFSLTPNVELVAGEQCTATIFASQVHDQDLVDSDPNTDALLANHAWSFVVASGTPPPYPASVHLAMGNPSNATTDLGQPQNYLMEKPEFTLSYNRDQGRPNWVSWHLSNEWYGSLARVDSFRADPQVPPDWYRVQGTDFSGSGFDRGHMVPNADRDKETSIPINQATFLMTNMVAQAGGNNSGPWGALESELRVIADAGNELYIIAGPEGAGGTGDFGGVTTTIAGGNVTVPANTWKVALVLPIGGDDVSRVTCATRTIAVIMPNVESIAGDDWTEFLTSVDAVEALTGYDLFSNLPDNVEYCVEAGINGTNPPADLDPPVVSCAAADTAWHAGNVTLACTASDSASGLASTADSSFSLVTSVAAGVETANALTDSRIVCDAVGNCATAGPIGGNKIDRKAPSIVIATPTSGASYQMLSSVTAAFACADSGSGPNGCVGTTANGAAIDTASAGAKTFSVTATDAAGNTATVSVSYTVLSAAQGLELVAASLRAIIASSTKAPLTARAGNALRKIEDAIAELSETPADTHHAAISIRQAVQQIEGLRNQGLLPAAVANALLAQLAGIAF